MKATAVRIVRKLTEHGYRAYFAGGCVRDYLLKKEPHDYDIATNAKPEQIEALFAKTIPVGRQFGIVVVVEDSYHFEIATFRSDSGSSDGRRPDAVLFTDPREDALRRDFTINGMFYDPMQKKVLDYVEGQRDLKERLINFIGSPARRIQEDHLRIIRAVRLVHKINGQYHPKTYKAIKHHAALMSNVSSERVRDEMNKILINKNRSQALEDLAELDILTYILPELLEMKGVAQPRQYHLEGSCWKHMLRSLASLKHTPSLELVWAVMLHDIGKPHTFQIEDRVRFNGHDHKSSEIARQILRRLHFSKKQMDEICWLIAHHMMLGNLARMSREKQAKWVLHPHFWRLLALLKADAGGSKPVDLSLYRQIRALAIAIRKKLPKKIPKLIAGDFLIRKYHVPEGPLIGVILEKLHVKQLRGEVKTKQDALKFIDRILKNSRLLSTRPPLKKAQQKPLPI